MAANSYVVTAPLVIAKNTDGSDRYLYTGAVLPDGQDPTWLQQMLDEGLVATADDVEAIAEANAVRGAVADVPDNSEGTTSDEKPARRTAK